MKSLFSRWAALGAAVCMMGLQACGSSTQTDGTASSGTTATETKVTLTDDVRADAVSILDGYYGLKDAMVTSDDAVVRTAADTLLARVADFDATGAGASASAITSLVDAIRFGATNVREAGDIDAQREYLPALTENMKALVTGYDLADASVFVQYCPMAFDNKGAYWLSSSEQVVNPYFGDMMLHCGEVTETL